MPTHSACSSFAPVFFPMQGWIHHLARHSVACFLTRGDLYVSWERGKDVFEEELIDADHFVNAGNWMWLSASAFFYQYFRCGACMLGSFLSVLELWDVTLCALEFSTSTLSVGCMMGGMGDCLRAAAACLACSIHDCLKSVYAGRLNSKCTLERVILPRRHRSRRVPRRKDTKFHFWPVPAVLNISDSFLPCRVYSPIAFGKKYDPGKGDVQDPCLAYAVPWAHAVGFVALNLRRF